MSSFRSILHGHTLSTQNLPWAGGKHFSSILQASINRPVTNMFRPHRLYCNKCILVCFCALVVILLVYYNMTESKSLIFSYNLFSERKHQFTNTSLLFREQYPSKNVSRQECIHPELRVDDPVMTKFLKILPAPQCLGEDWVYVDNGIVKFSSSALKRHGPISCDYYPLERDGDDYFKWRTPVLHIPAKFSITSDFFRVVCKGSNGSTYDGVHVGVAYTKDRAHIQSPPLPMGLDGLSIAILGFDSMSRMSWLRRLNKTRHYFHDKLGGIELEAHNIVGDGTTAVMFPMLTGKFEWELPECRSAIVTHMWRCVI